MSRWKKIALFSVMAALPLGAVVGQGAQAPAAQPAVNRAVPAAPAADATAEPLAPLPPPPPAVWRPEQARALLNYIYNVGREGLSPSDYDGDGLLAALATNDSATFSAAATDRFNKLSSDLALGHVRGEDRIGWHVVDKDLDEGSQRALLDAALRDNKVADALNSLLPSHPQYGSLKTALSVTPRTDTAKVNRIRLNMDRWRWLPRDLGERYIIVNVPSYYATLVEDGTTRWKTRAVAGAIKTPTPALTATAVGVILNPTWEVPKSIWPEVAGKPGYVAVKGKNGKFSHWRQPAGPTNALGQLKFVMYNEHNIYLHDTNAKSRFNSQIRAASHGCIRTKDVVTLATMLLEDDNGSWTSDKIQKTLAEKKTVQANFVKPLPVYIVYFSAAANVDGSIVSYEDVYKRDNKVIAALLDAGGKAPTKKPAEKVAAR